MMNRKFWGTFLVLAFAVAGLACGDDDDTAEAGTDDPDTTAEQVDDDGAEETGEAPYFDLLPERIQDAGTMTFVGDLQAPLRMLGEDGETLIGLQADFVDAFEPLLGVEIDQQTVSGFAAVKTGLESGRFDFAFGPLADSAAAEETLDLVTFMTATPAFLFPAGQEVDGTTDFCGEPLARVAGSAPMTAAFDTLSEACVDAGMEPVEALEFADRAATQLAVLGGRAVATGTTPADAAFTSQERPDEFDFILGEEDRFAVTYLGFATRKDDTELRDAMMAAMEHLFEDGTYTEIMERYSLEQVSVEEPVLNRATADE